MKRTTLVFLILFVLLTTIALQSFSLSVLNVTAYTSPPSSNSSYDYKDSWAKDVIEHFIAIGVIAPDKNGNVEPKRDMTRAEVAMSINKAFKFTKSAEIDYADVQSGDLFYKDLQIARGIGYMIGGGDGEPFRPNLPITRQEMSILISRILELEPDIEPAKKFLDFDEMPTDEAKGAIGAMADASVKVLEGVGESLFAPNSNITREQAYTMLYRAEKIYAELQSGERKYTSLTIFEKGTFGKQSITKNYNDVEIYAQDTILQNLIIWGDLYINGGVGNANIELNNITVKGNTYIHGGGIDGIKITDSQLNLITVNKTDNLIRVAFVGTSSAEQILMYSGAVIDAPEMIIPKMIISPIANSTDTNIRISAMLAEKISVASCANISVADSIVQELEITRTASGSIISVASGANIISAIVDAPATISGSGTVVDARISVDGVSISTPYTKITDLWGVTVENNAYGIVQQQSESANNNNNNNINANTDYNNYTDDAYWTTYWANYYSANNNTANDNANQNTNNNTNTDTTPNNNTGTGTDTNTSTGDTNKNTDNTPEESATEVTEAPIKNEEEHKEFGTGTIISKAVAISPNTVEVQMGDYGLNENNFLIIEFTPSGGEFEVITAHHVYGPDGDMGKYILTISGELSIKENGIYEVIISKNGIMKNVFISWQS